MAALGYLIAIHKLEYFLNARIVGGQISARSWNCWWPCWCSRRPSACPGWWRAVYYAYLKSELKAEGLV